MPNNTALILIDYQQAFDDLAYWGSRNNPQAEANAALVLAAFRSARLPVIHVAHDSSSPASLLRPGHPGNAPMPFALPLAGEPVIRKSVNSAFIGTDLEARLRALGIDHLVIMGGAGRRSAPQLRIFWLSEAVARPDNPAPRCGSVPCCLPELCSRCCVADCRKRPALSFGPAARLRCRLISPAPSPNLRSLASGHRPSPTSRTVRSGPLSGEGEGNYRNKVRYVKYAVIARSGRRRGNPAGSSVWIASLRSQRGVVGEPQQPKTWMAGSSPAMTNSDVTALSAVRALSLHRHGRT